MESGFSLFIIGLFSFFIPYLYGKEMAFGRL